MHFSLEVIQLRHRQWIFKALHLVPLRCGLRDWINCLWETYCSAGRGIISSSRSKEWERLDALDGRPSGVSDVPVYWVIVCNRGEVFLTHASSFFLFFFYKRDRCGRFQVIQIKKRWGDQYGVRVEGSGIKACFVTVETQAWQMLKSECAAELKRERC